MQRDVIGLPTGEQGIQFADSRNDMSGVERRNNLLHGRRNRRMVFHVRLANVAVDHQQQRVTHDHFFSLEMIQDKSENIAKHGNHLSLAMLLPLMTAACAILQIDVIEAYPAQVGDGGNQEMVLGVDQFVTSNQLSRQLASRQPVGRTFGQIIDSRARHARNGNHPLLRHPYSESIRKRYSTVAYRLVDTVIFNFKHKIQQRNNGRNLLLTEHQKHWGVDQWAAYLSSQELPCMPRSKARLLELEAEKGERLAACDLADIAAADPFLCLRLLREAENHRAQRLGHETTNPLGTVMQLGTDAVHELMLACPETDESNLGLAECEARAHLASRLALRWGAARADISPDEVAMAALLSEIGELLLWSFAEELPLAALEALHSGRSPRSLQAQVDTCGFRFKDLTLKCALIWHLPSLLTQLIRGIDNTRANLSRLCVDTARHISSGPDDPALPADIAAAKNLIPGVSLEWLAEQLPGLDEEHVAAIALKAADLLDPTHH